MFTSKYIVYRFINFEWLIRLFYNLCGVWSEDETVDIQVLLDFPIEV